MPKIEIVWVYGASAAGKATFIRSVIAGNPAVRKEFSWENKKIGACQESLDWIAQSPDDKTTENNRRRLQSIIPALAAKYEVVLVKGQDIDLAFNTPQAVRQALPAALHRIIFLDVGAEELFERVIHKPWWRATLKRAEEEGWLQEQTDRLTDMQNSFEFTVINGRVIGHYEEEESLPSMF